MAKTNAPSAFLSGGRPIRTNALPDPFDALDLLYRPRLEPLPSHLDQRAGLPILDQVGDSCTGHAVAALVDTVLARGRPKTRKSGAPRDLGPGDRVSPYMLYAMARRYDEFPGTADVGSSLRGAFKGWYHHGVCREDMWSSPVQPKNLYDPDFVAACARIPLGAYFRVNVSRIDDMQSAITELNAIAVSAVVDARPREGPRHAMGDARRVAADDRGGHRELGQRRHRAGIAAPHDPRRSALGGQKARGVRRR